MASGVGLAAVLTCTWVLSGRAATGDVVAGLGVDTFGGLLLAVAITAAIWVVRRWGPNRMKGMATADEAEAILGLSRLRRVAPIIRPDLYGAQTTTSRNGDHDGYHPHR